MPSKRRTISSRKHEYSSEKTADTTTDKRIQINSNETEIENSNKQQKVNFEEFEQIFFENRRKRSQHKISRKYTYVYSESYMNIEKLVSSYGKSLKARCTIAEFQAIEELNKQKKEKKKKKIMKTDDSKESYLRQCFKNRRSQSKRKY